MTTGLRNIVNFMTASAA